MDVAPEFEPAELIGSPEANGPLKLPVSLVHRLREAVLQTNKARKLAEAGSLQDARELFLAAARTRLELIPQLGQQPQRAMVAEAGARCALRGGDYTLGRRLAKAGLDGSPPDDLELTLLQALGVATVLEALSSTNEPWDIDWDATADENPPGVVATLDRKRLVVEVDRNFGSPTELEATSDRLVIGMPPLASKDALLEILEGWVPQRPRIRLVRRRDVFGDLVAVHT